MSSLILTNGLSPEGFIVEIDGKFQLEYGTFTGALKTGLELRQKFPHSQVKVHDIGEGTQMLATEQSENRIATAAN
jgi:hypothetical protein